jgi:uncharacterized membrane protein
MWKSNGEPVVPEMEIWRMRIACYISKATNTLSEHVICIAFLLQQWLHERVWILRYGTLSPLFHVRCSFLPRICVILLDVSHNGFNWSPSVRYGVHIDSVIITEGMSVLFCKLWPQLCCLNHLMPDLYCCLLDTRVLSVILNNISVIMRERDSLLVTREGQQRGEWAYR